MNNHNPVSNEPSVKDSDSRIFRASKKHRKQGYFFLIFYVLVGIFVTCGIWFEEPIEERVYGVIFVGLFFSFLSLCCLWMVLDYKHGSLTIQNSTVIQQGVIFRKEIDLSSAKQIRWGLSQGGSITLKSLKKKILINLDYYELNDRLWLIRYFQSALPEESQHHWDLFCYRIAIPLRDYKPDEIPSPEPGEILITRQRYDRFFIPLIIVAGISGAIAAWYSQSPRFLIAPIPFMMLWYFLSHKMPKQGFVDRRISADKELKQCLIFQVLWLGIAAIGSLIFGRMNFPEPQNTIYGVCLMCIWIIILLIIVSKLDRAKHQKDLKEAQQRVQQWKDCP